MKSEPAPQTALTAVDYDPFGTGMLARVAPSTEPQREIWLAANLGTDASLAYNESITLRLRGALDLDALAGALQDIVDRHDALRAGFGPDGETFCVFDGVSLGLPLTDLSRLAAPERDAAFAGHLLRAVETPFVLEEAPLLRAELVRHAIDDHVLVLTAHHIICDGWSWWIIVRELAALYKVRHGTPSEPLPPGDSFADYALKEAAHPDVRTLAADETYWLARFSDAVPVLELPLDRPRPPRRTFASAREDHVIDAALLGAIRQLGARHGASLFATLLGSFAALLGRLSAQDDIVIGIPAAAQALDDHENLVGHCVNLLPLRWNIEAAAPFESLLDTTQTTLLDALEHQRYTFGTLMKKLDVSRDPSRLPLISVLFNIDQALDHEATAFPGATMEFASNARRFENFELFINAVQEHGELRLECQYNTDLFDAATVRRWLRAYETLLRRATERPQAPVGALPLVDEAGLRELTALQPAPTAFDREQRAHEFFESQCDRDPERIAVRCGDAAVTYAQLEWRANRIAHLLREAGAHRGSLVGIALDRGIDMVAALLGVLKTGAGYLPLDPEFPAERLGFMVSDAGLAALITERAHAARFDLRGRPVLLLDELDAALDAANVARIGRDADAANPDSVAYVIYTSGSTGRPKGVLIPHSATSNFLTAVQSELDMVADDRLVAVTTLSFDIAFMELMLPLSVGAAVIIASRDQTRDGRALRTLIEANAANVMQATPAGWHVLLEAGWRGHSKFRAVSGGEPMTLALAEALLARCESVWNGYGPTEATVYSTWWKVEDPQSGISIGRPLANTSIWILDANRQPCPLGVPGEICVGGGGVALGYLNQPLLTDDRFIADPFVPTPGARLYRTGDRGRWSVNSNIEHLGRLDFQVKLRGFRIEPGEIETNLVALADIAHAVVTVREDRPRDVRLVAYVVAAPDALVDETKLRTQLGKILPDYMVPQHFVLLNEIPLLPNGKIDRKALPAPSLHSIAQTALRLAPRNDDERRVAAAMEAVLHLPDLDVRDNFFALGGHSLLAAQLTARLNREFGVALSLRTLFDAPTVEALAVAIGAQTADDAIARAQPIEHRADQSHAPLSLMQQRLWSLEELHPGRVTYNTPSAHRLRGSLDEDAFERAFGELVRRQPAMRTSIRAGDGVVEQIVEAQVNVQVFPAEDLSIVPDGEREEVLHQRLQALTDTPFDLTRAPLFSVRMFRMGADDHVLFFMPHHIIWDGWSFDIFYVELSQLYRAFKEGSPSPLAPLQVTYGDFAVWHAHWLEGSGFQAQLAYWREHLAQISEAKPLPTDKPRRPGMSGEGRTAWIHVSRQSTDAMHEVARRADATLNMALLALYYIVLYSGTGRRRLVVATPVRGRNQTEVESVMGYFTNLLPLDAILDPALSFVDFVREVKRVVIDAFGNPDVPLEYLQHELGGQRDAGAGVLYQTLFSFQDARQRVTDWGGLQHEQILLFQRGATEDLGLWFLENANGMVGGVTYNVDILLDETAELLRERYLTLMARVANDPNQSIASLVAVDAADIARLQRWNDTAMDVDIQSGLAGLFEKQVDRTPSTIALTSGSWGTSYHELEQRANRIAACLRARGVNGSTIVGLCMEPSVNQLAAILGVLKIAATAVLLDPADPPQRIADIIADSRVAVLVGDSQLTAVPEWPREQALWFDLDTAELVAAASERNAPQDPGVIDAETLSFVFYTPAATGKPRGVGITHHALASRVLGLRRALDLSADDRILGTAPVSSAFSVIEFLLSMCIGAEFTQAKPRETADGAAINALAQSCRASVILAADDVWQSMLLAGLAEMPDARAVCAGGIVKPGVAFQIAKSCGQVWNALVSTEAGIIATCGRIDRPPDGFHSGRPLANTIVRVLDAQQCLCPIGADGEVYVGGDACGRPFGVRAETDSPWATPDPYSDDPHARLVCTSIRGRWLANGNLEAIAHTDRRVCIRGQDVDVSAIEARILAQPDVVQAVVVGRESDAQGGRLVAYFAIAPGSKLDAESLRAALDTKLTSCEMPTHLVLLDALPLLPDGTVNLAALPRPSHLGEGAQTSMDADQPKTASERLLADVWREMLNIPTIAATDNFFDLGGHSLLATAMVTRVEQQSGVRLNLLRVANGTLRALAAELPETWKRGISDTSASTLAGRVRKLFGHRKVETNPE